MTKKELIKLVQDVSPVELTLGQAETLASGLVQKIIDKMQTDGTCNIYGLGKLKVFYKPPKTGRNPQNGEKVDIPAKGRISFKACGAMQDVFDTLAATK